MKRERRHHSTGMSLDSRYDARAVAQGFSAHLLETAAFVSCTLRLWQQHDLLDYHV